MSGPGLCYSHDLSLMIAFWLPGGCPMCNITSMFKGGGKGGERSKPICVCFSFKEHSHKPQQQLQFSTFWPELCLVAKLLLEKKHQGIDIYWVTSMYGHSFQYVSWQYEFLSKKCCIKHFLNWVGGFCLYLGAFVLFCHYTAQFFALPLMRLPVFRTFGNAHSKNHVQQNKTKC